MGRRAVIVVAAVVVCVAWSLAPSHQAAQQAPSKEASLDSMERDRLLATGKRLFVERCGKCHDVRGDKLLKTGLPLNERKLSTAEIANAVQGRFRDKSEEEKRAVVLYIRSFLVHAPTGEAGVAPSAPYDRHPQ